MSISRPRTLATIVIADLGARLRSAIGKKVSRARSVGGWLCVRDVALCIVEGEAEPEGKEKEEKEEKRN